MLVFVGLSGWAGYGLTMRNGLVAAQADAERRLDLFDQTLEGTVERFHYLPGMIAQAGEVQAALAKPEDADAAGKASIFLSTINGTAGADEIFVMNLAGEIVAASNWWSSQSLVGKTFSTRPYFTQAIETGDAKYYATGLATSVPGYFLAQRVEDETGIIGVAVAKINLGEIEALWWRSGELIAIVDANEVVVLSTRPDWRYRPVETVARGREAGLQDAMRYGSQRVHNAGIMTQAWSDGGMDFATLGSEDSETSGEFLVDEQWLPTHGWRMLSFTPLNPVKATALTTAFAGALGSAALFLTVMLLIQRQRTIKAQQADHERLERRVEQRTAELSTLNQQLRDEVAERRRAEKDRREAQASLVQAAKLASLGQALAGVAHEISQPVAALTTQIASARLLAGRHPEARIGQILLTMDSVLGRLASLTSHLRTFARKTSDAAFPSDIEPIIANALQIVGHRLKEFDITLDWQRPSQQIYALANPVHLEQVLINLIANAADAMEHSDIRRLSINAALLEDQVTIAVADTGTGIAEDSQPLLFDPFFTTKEPGRGLGLGLSISYGLIRDAGGTISVRSSGTDGSVFTVILPSAGQVSMRRELRA